MEKSNDLARVDPKVLTEQQAITLLKQGNIKGLSILVHDYQVKAVHSAFLITRNRDLSEDIVQDAFLNIYRKIDQFDDNRPFGPWFLRIVINSAIKATKQQAKFISLDDPEEDCEKGGFIFDWLIDPSKSPEKQMESAQNHELIWQAMQQLSPNQRAVIVLRYFLDKNESEMIQELNRPSSTIKWWLYAARKRLQQIYQPDDFTSSL